MLIDEYLPDSQVSLKAYTIEIDAPIEPVYQVVRKLDLRNAYLLRVLFWLRSLPGRLTGRNPLGPTLADLELAGLTLVEEAPPHELLLGLVGKIWTPGGGLLKVSSADFRNYSNPDVAKVVVSFSLESLPGGRTRLTTKTRAFCPGAEGREKLLRYARFISVISGMTRKSALRGIRRQAHQIRH
ncbi:MAG: hypothetical protein R3E82_04005 [Pseudomonadales bacterium]